MKGVVVTSKTVLEKHRGRTLIVCVLGMGGAE